MIETLIPFLLVAHVPIDVYDVYYGSQYTFNVSNAMEYNFGNVTQHVNMVAKLKCRNSGVYSLICSVTDASRQWYQETGSKNSDNPAYMTFPVFNVGPFEILLKNGTIHSIFVDASQANTSQHIIILEIAELLNIWWTNVDESEIGLSTVNDAKVCKSVIKLTKQKKIGNKIGKFVISSPDGGLNMTSGITLNFKKTLAAHSPCSKRLYLLYGHDNVHPKILNATQIKAKSSYSRVIVSDNEFVSFTENVANYCPDSRVKCNYNIHQRISLALDSIDKSTTDFSTITRPMDIFKNLESSVSLYL